MKRALVPFLLVGLVATSATLAQQPSKAAQPAARAAAPPRQPVDLDRFKQAIAENRRKMFASAMSNLSTEQLQTFWAVYADFEKEKNAITSARMDLAQKYTETFTSTTGLADSDIVEIVHDMAALQHKNIELRVKYFDIYRARIDARAAGRFGLVDDYITTAVRLDLLDQIPFPGDEGRK
jgi:hypothetical protein